MRIEQRRMKEAADAKTRIHRNNTDWSLSIRTRNGHPRAGQPVFAQPGDPRLAIDKPAQTAQLLLGLLVQQHWLFRHFPQAWEALMFVEVLISRVVASHDTILRPAAGARLVNGD